MDTVRIAGKNCPVIRVDEEHGVASGIDVTLSNKKKGSRARLIAMMHVADGEFYAGVEDTIRTTPGAVPLLEGVTGAPITKDTPEPVRNIFRIMRYTNAIHRSLLHVIGNGTVSQMAWQKKAFPGPTADVTREQLAEYIVQRGGNLDRLRMVMEMLVTVGKKAMLKKRPENIIRELGESAAGLSIAKNFLWLYPTGKMFAEGVTDFREDHLLRGISAVDDGKTAILPWGAAHISPLVKGLTKNGQWTMEQDSVSYRKMLSIKERAHAPSPALPDHRE